MVPEHKQRANISFLMFALRKISHNIFFSPVFIRYLRMLGRELKYINILPFFIINLIF